MGINELILDYIYRSEPLSSRLNGSRNVGLGLRQVLLQPLGSRDETFREKKTKTTTEMLGSFFSWHS